MNANVSKTAIKSCYFDIIFVINKATKTNYFRYTIKEGEEKH